MLFFKKYISELTTVAENEKKNQTKRELRNSCSRVKTVREKKTIY